MSKRDRIRWVSGLVANCVMSRRDDSISRLEWLQACDGGMMQTDTYRYRYIIDSNSSPDMSRVNEKLRPFSRCLVNCASLLRTVIPAS